MKRILFLTLLVITTVFNANAQDYETPKDEISISWGYGTVPLIGLDLGECFFNESEKSIGAISAQYMYNMNKHWGFGVTAVYEHLYHSEDKCENYDTFFSIMSTVRAYWFRTKSVGMYSRLALGYATDSYKTVKLANSNTDKKTDSFVAFQVTPVGIEFGSNKLSAFIELGFGYQGVGNAGIRLGF